MNFELFRKVANPKLTLYAFHLRNNLAQGSDRPVEDSDRLWEKCQQLGQKLGIPRLEFLPERLREEGDGEIGIPPDKNSPQSNYLELLPQEQVLKFSAIPNGSSPQLRGEVYPLQIHDTYAVDITLRYPYPNVDLSELQGLNPQGCLLPSQIQASLGQTLMLFAQPVGEIDDLQAFADACLAAILPESETEQFLHSPPVTGQLLGSPIFEYENIQDRPAEHGHILIWLNCHPQTEALEEQGDYYQPLVNLLCFRSKILYAYAESRWCNAQAKQLYTTIEQHIRNFSQIVQSPNRLQQLKDLLTQLPQMSLQYSHYLRDLEDHKNTVKTNIQNYSTWMAKLEALPECELTFLQQFLDRARNKLQQQIEVDQSFLMPGKELFQELLNNIRAIVAIDQIKSDRNLELWIAFVGTGLAVSSISSAINPRPIETILGTTLANEIQPWHPVDLLYTGGDLLIHIFLGLVFALIVRAAIARFLIY
ncbi:MAG: hypothetical protein AB4426_34085 [Xenococcaceae cyanobacterium]